jgi:hypothetical protein
VIDIDCAQASKETDWVYKPFRTTIEELGRWVHGSAERQAIWVGERKSTGEGGQMLKMPSDTRWLTVEQACQSLRSSLLTTAKTLDAAKKTDAVAKGILHQLCSVKFLTVLYYFCDALPWFSRLSLVFQRADVDISMIDRNVTQTKLEIEKLIDAPGALSIALLSLTCCMQASTLPWSMAL